MWVRDDEGGDVLRDYKYLAVLMLRGEELLCVIQRGISREVTHKEVTN